LSSVSHILLPCPLKKNTLEWLLSQAQKLYYKQESTNLNSLSDHKKKTRRLSISSLSDLASDLTELSGNKLGNRTLTKMENSSTLTGMYATLDLTFMFMNLFLTITPEDHQNQAVISPDIIKI
jgi:hypothetical protein